MIWLLFRPPVRFREVHRQHVTIGHQQIRLRPVFVPAIHILRILVGPIVAVKKQYKLGVVAEVGQLVQLLIEPGVGKRNVRERPAQTR